MLVYHGSRSVFWLMTVPGWFLTTPGWFSWFFTVPEWFFTVPEWFFMVRSRFLWFQIGFYYSRMCPDVENTPKCICFICILASRSCPPGLAGFGLVIMMMMMMMRRRIVSFTWAGVGAAQKGVGRGIGQSTDPDRRNSSGGGTTTTLATLRLQER